MGAAEELEAKEVEGFFAEEFQAEAVGVGVEAVVSLHHVRRQELAVERGNLFRQLVLIQLGAAALHAADAAATHHRARQRRVGNLHAEPRQTVRFFLGREVEFAPRLLGIVRGDQAEEAAGQGAVFVDAAAVLRAKNATAVGFDPGEEEVAEGGAAGGFAFLGREGGEEVEEAEVFDVEEARVWKQHAPQLAQRVSGKVA